MFLKILLQVKILLGNVANVFQLPAVFLNANESSNFTKNEELNRFFLQHTLISIIKQYESEFNRKLLTPFRP